MGVWTKNGKILVGNNGHPIVCDECPCGGLTCEQSVDQEVARMLAERDEQDRPVWSLYGTYSPDFSCAAWHYDDVYDEWILDRTASGNLIVALKVGTTVTSTTDCVPSFLLYAKLLYSASQGLWHTVGCECVVQDHQCTHRKASLRDYSIGGVLPPWQLPEGTPAASYEPYMACQPDPCQVLKLKMQAAYYWHGGTWYGEGYYDYLLSPEDLGYWPFQMAIRWQEDVSESLSTSAQPTQYLTHLACDCSGIATHTIRDGEAVLEYAGACSIQTPCVNLLRLHNQAMINGWIWHGEGVIAHRAKASVNGTTYYGDWYALREQVWYSDGSYGEEGIAYAKRMCCAETPTGYWVINCDCGSAGYYAKNDPVEAYWKYFDLDGVCACSWDDGGTPDRELILTYPEEFGIIDIVWGNHSKFDYEYSYMTSPESDNPSHLVTATGTYIIGTLYEDTRGVGQCCLYIDYRCMCFTGKALWKDGTTKTWVRGIYPRGSKGAPTERVGWTLVHYYWTRPKRSTSGSDSPWGIYDDAYFRGDHFTPFTKDPDIEFIVNTEHSTNFTGFTYKWYHVGEESDTWINQCEWGSGGCYSDEDDAKSSAGCYATVPTPCIGVGGADGHSWQLNPLLTPDFTVVDHPCQISTRTHEFMGDYTEWCIDQYRWITIGSMVGTYWNGSGYACAWDLYLVQYVETNKGWIIKGLDGHQATYTLLGSNHYPQYVCRQWWEDPDEPPSGWNDIVLPDNVDEDMHWCCLDFDFDIPDESDSEDQSTSDESTSEELI